MGPLRNPRHEAFARALFENKSADEAYIAAGYSENRGNAARLKAKESIQSRLAELQHEAAKASEVTIQSLLAELEYARSRADSLDQLSAAVKATSEKAKISGLLTQRIEIGAPGDFERGDKSNEEIADALLDDFKTDKVFSEQDEIEFRVCLLGWLGAVEKFLQRGRFKWVVEADPVPRRITGNGSVKPATR